VKSRALYVSLQFPVDATVSHTGKKKSLSNIMKIFKSFDTKTTF